MMKEFKTLKLEVYMVTDDGYTLREILLTDTENIFSLKQELKEKYKDKTIVFVEYPVKIERIYQ